MTALGVADDQLIKELKEILGQAAKLIQAVESADKVFRSFAPGRRLSCP